MSFESVYERIFPSLFRYVHRWTGDADVAEDLTQEAFVRYLGSAVREEDARLWLFKVAGNLVRDRARRRSRRERLVHKWVWHQEERREVRDEARTDRAAELARAREALGRLGDRDRQMLLMREEGFPYRDIADATGVAPGSVGTLLGRALRRFKEAYEST